MRWGRFIQSTLILCLLTIPTLSSAEEMQDPAGNDEATWEVIDRVHDVMVNGSPLLPPLTIANWIVEGEQALMIIDTRQPVDFNNGHIPGAVNIPLGEIFKRETVESLPKDKRLVIHCYSGYMQNHVWFALVALGYDATTIKGGWKAWSAMLEEHPLIAEEITKRVIPEEDALPEE